MASEMLSKVLEAEQADKSARQIASEQARAIIEKSREDGAQTIARMKEAAEKDGQQIVSQAKELAREREAEAIKNADAQGAEIFEKASAKRQEAVDAVIKIVLA